MNHKQILDKMAAGQLVTTLDQEIANLTFIALAGFKNNWIDDKFAYVISKLMPRWQCFLNHHSPGSQNVDTFNVVLATILHKYGFKDASITHSAIASIRSLNSKTILSDSFYYSQSKMEQFLTGEPKELKKYPRQRWPTTYYRPKDVVSFEFEGKYIVAYICDYAAGGSPVVAFYDTIFSALPSIEELADVHALGRSYPGSDTPSVRYFEIYAIDGMTYLPDPAEQITLIDSNVKLEMDRSGLEESDGLCTHLELSSLQELYQSMSNTN